MSEKDIVIDVSNLKKSFSGKVAVEDFAIKVKKGEVWGFLGPNGSGKTTTLRMLCGLLTPDAGEGHCIGYDILTQTHEIKRHVGYMTQSFSLYQDLTAYENLDFIARTFGVKQRKTKINHFLKNFDLIEHQNKLAGNLSGGMRQRLALAGCLLHEPKLLLLDEPTAGVDPKARREFWDEIHLLSEQGITTLASTHYMDEAERCTKLLYIAYGHTLAQGTAADIIAKAAMHTWQARGDDLYKLAESLKNMPGIDQVAFFGHKLHVSSSDAVLLKSIIAEFEAQYEWKQIEPGLEDAFINLVEHVPGES